MNTFLAELPYDVMAIGNHELYVYSNALDMQCVQGVFWTRLTNAFRPAPPKLKGEIPYFKCQHHCCGQIQEYHQCTSRQ